MKKPKATARIIRRTLLVLQLIIFFAINLAPLVLLLILSGYIRPEFLASFVHIVLVLASPVLLVLGNVAARRTFRTLKRGRLALQAYCR